MSASLKRLLPWWAKIGAKVVLARLPFGYDVWRRAGLFLHGSMNATAYAFDVFARHHERCAPYLPRDGFNCLEIGPGDSVSSALVARAHGAAAVWLVDAGAFATREPAVYRAMAEHLRAKGMRAPAPAQCNDLPGLLAVCGARYLTDGLRSLAEIEDHRIDMVWSQAVLEHIRRAEFLDYMRELRRVMKPGAAASHRVDLTDHLGGSLNNLRFRRSTWEADWLASSGFYTNRIRFREMNDLFREAGFDVQILHVDRWPRLPVERSALDAEFAGLADDDLSVAGFDVLLRPTAA